MWTYTYMFVALDLTGLWYLQPQVGLDTIPPHHSDAILDLRRGWTGYQNYQDGESSLLRTSLQLLANVRHKHLSYSNFPISDK